MCIRDRSEGTVGSLGLSEWGYGIEADLRYHLRVQNPFVRSRRVRYFTPQEANALLPEIAAQLDELVLCVQRYEEVIVALRAGGARDEQRLAVEADVLRRESQEILDDITDRGVEVKGIAQKLLGFPALRNGQEAYLCWRQGDDRVEWWHPLNTGASARERVDYENLGIWEWCN